MKWKSRLYVVYIIFTVYIAIYIVLSVIYFYAERMLVLYLYTNVK